MPAFFLIARYKTVALWRALREQLFTLLVIAPMIVGGFYLVLEPTLSRLAEMARDASGSLTYAELFAVLLILCVLLLTTSLPSTVRLLYSLHSPDAYLDGLPVGAWTRFHIVAAVHLGKSLPVAVALLAAHHLLRGAGPWFNAETASRVVVAVAEIVLAAMILAMLLVHFRQMRAGRILLATIVLAAVAILGTAYPGLNALLFPLMPAAVELTRISAAALGWGDIAGLPWLAWPVVSVHLVWIPVLYLAAGGLFARWRTDDREKALESVRRNRAQGGLLEQFVLRVAGSVVAPQVVRDLRLTMRGFSIAVYVAVALALLFQAGVVFAADQPALRPVWFERVVLFGGAMSTLSLSALAPLLLSFQRQYFWVEKSSGVEAVTLSKAKVWYACFLSLPVWLLTGLTGIALIPLGAVDALLFLAVSASVCLTVASFIGAFSFEIVSSPVLGLLLSGLFAMGLAGLFIIAGGAWPVPAFLYVYFMGPLLERAEHHAEGLGVES